MAIKISDGKSFKMQPLKMNNCIFQFSAIPGNNGNQDALAFVAKTCNAPAVTFADSQAALLLLLLGEASRVFLKNRTEGKINRLHRIGILAQEEGIADCKQLAHTGQPPDNKAVFQPFQAEYLSVLL